MNVPLLGKGSSVFSPTVFIEHSDRSLDSKIIGASESKQEGATWISSMIIIVAYMMGIGVLGLAHAFSKVGWLVGYTILGLGLVASVYSGILLSRMKQKIPSATIFSDLGQAAYGNLGEAFSTIFGYTYLVGLCFSFHLGSALALKELTDGLCFVYCSGIVAALVTPLSQSRSVHELKWIVYIGAIAIVIPALIIIVEVTINGRYEQVYTVVIADAGFETAMVACMNVMFAISGQVIFVEIMTEMKDPSEFPKSVVGASSIFVLVYSTMAFVGYYFIGSGVINPISYNLTDPFSRRLCSAFIFVHIIVAYVMEVIILARAFERLVLHQQHEDSRHATHRDRVVWLLMTSFLVVISFLVCNLTPFINSLMGFVGAISGVTTTFVFPFLFAAVILKDEMTGVSQRLHQAFGFFATGIAIVGVYASIHMMMRTYETKIPFEC